uniref:Uncharacterized protein n=1 Tax=Meloidogyne javanica TaxID=6303 RepID=A0A915LFV3_MELJA
MIFLFCDRSNDAPRCVSKVRPGGNCKGFPNADICYNSTCVNDVCVVLSTKAATITATSTVKMTEEPSTTTPKITEVPTTKAARLTVKPTPTTPKVTDKPSSTVKPTEKQTTVTSRVTEKPTSTVRVTEVPTTQPTRLTEKPTTKTPKLPPDYIQSENYAKSRKVHMDWRRDRSKVTKAFCQQKYDCNKEPTFGLRALCKATIANVINAENAEKLDPKYSPNNTEGIAPSRRELECVSQSCVCPYYG